MTSEYVRFGRSKIHYEIVRSPSRKNTEIRIISKDRVEVLAPKGKPDTDIRDIVKSNSRWIFRKQLHRSNEKNRPLAYTIGSSLPHLGKNYRIHLVVDGKKTTATHSGNDFLFTFHKGGFVVVVLVNGSQVIKPSQIKAQYEKWIADKAASFIERRVNKYAELLRINPNDLKIRFKSQRNRVGSLGRNLVLIFNKNLLRLPQEIVDYVIVHELCHVKIPDHSSKYWQLVSYIMPDYEERKRWLEENKSILLS